MALINEEQSMEEEQKHYRYTDSYCNGQAMLYMETFVTLRETKKGYWVIPEYLQSGIWADEHKEKQKRFILKLATKKHCYPSKDLAMTAFYFRKCRQVKILESKLEDAKLARNMAESIFLKKKNELEFM